MAKYFKRPQLLEAHYWNGQVPFQPVAGFNPDISIDPHTGEAMVQVDFLSLPIKISDFITKDSHGNYDVIPLEIFLKDYVNVEEVFSTSDSEDS